jgi:hypothetical protein
MYHHTQIGHVTRLAALAGGAAAVWAMVVVGAPPFVWPLLAVLLLAGFAFGSLTIEVTHDRLTFWFGPGILRRSFALAEIDSCAAVTTPGGTAGGFISRPGGGCTTWPGAARSSWRCATVARSGSAPTSPSSCVR